MQVPPARLTTSPATASVSLKLLSTSPWAAGPARAMLSELGGQAWELGVFCCFPLKPQSVTGRPGTDWVTSWSTELPCASWDDSVPQANWLLESPTHILKTSLNPTQEEWMPAGTCFLPQPPACSWLTKHLCSATRRLRDTFEAHLSKFNKTSRCASVNSPYSWLCPTFLSAVFLKYIILHILLHVCLKSPFGIRQEI